MRIFSIIRDILAPIKCYSCKKEGHFLCSECDFKMLKFEPSCFICKQGSEEYKIHKKCKNKRIFYDRIIIKYHYSGYYISKMVKDGKYYSKKDVLLQFGEQLGDLIIHNIKDYKECLLIPVPLHFFRKIKRGYNQSEIICNGIEEVINIKQNKSILYRENNTRQQSKLSKKERHKNIKNSFAINKKYIDIIDKRRVILVDDVVSTGSTLNEISKVLKENGVTEVVCICIASD